MTERSTVLRLIAVALVAYGLYIATYVPAMLIGQPVLVLLICFVLQVVCTFAAAVGVWRGQSWGAVAVVVVGAAIAATWLIEGFLLGIVAYLYALLVAVLAIVVAVIIAAYVGGDNGRAPTDRSPR